MRAKDSAGRDCFLVIEVPPGSGVVHIGIGGARAVVSPCKLAQLRAIGLQALAVALLERGRW